jgi:hypothetical protein
MNVLKTKFCVFLRTTCYGPYIGSSTTTEKRHERVGRDSGTKVAESHDVTLLVQNVGTWERDVLTY